MYAMSRVSCRDPSCPIFISTRDARALIFNAMIGHISGIKGSHWLTLIPPNLTVAVAVVIDAHKITIIKV